MNEPSPLPEDGVPAEEPRDRNGVPSAAFEKRAARRQSLAFVVLLLLAGALGYGFWQHYRLHAEMMATAAARRDFVPTVRTAAVRASESVRLATWPAATEAFEQANIYARASGYISKRNVDIGSLVQADSTSGTFMFTIMQGNVIRTQVFVPQDEAFGLKPGIDAVVHVPEIPDRTFPGKVTRIADALQPGSRTLLTEIDIPNHDGVLAPGIYCTIELHIPRKTPSFSVSADAVIFNAGGLQVAVVENGVVHLRKVSVVRDLGQEVEINSGVKAGDQVVLNPAVDLADGSKVRVRAPATPTS